MTKTRLYLIGFMGCGKTTVGKMLSAALGYSFVDLDLFIEQRYLKSVSQLFAEYGEAHFREVERRALHEVSTFEQVVISTGGGSPCFFDNMEFMNREGLTIYLKASVSTLYERLLKGRSKRPLIANKSKEEMVVYIEEMLEKREPFYSQSALILPINPSVTKQELKTVVVPQYISVLHKYNKNEA